MRSFAPRPRFHAKAGLNFVWFDHDLNPTFPASQRTLEVISGAPALLTSSSALLASQYRARVLSLSPSAYFRFEETAGSTTAYSEVGGITGAYGPVSSYRVADPVGGGGTGVRFGASSGGNVLNSTTGLAGSNELTVEAVVYLGPPLASDDQYAFHLAGRGNAGGADANYHVYIFGNYLGNNQHGLLGLYGSPGGAWQGLSPLARIPQGMHHIAVTRRADGYATTHIDGVLMGEAYGSSATLPTTATTTYSSAHASSGVSELAIYNYALTTTQIRDNYLAWLSTAVVTDNAQATLSSSSTLTVAAAAAARSGAATLASTSTLNTTAAAAARSGAATLSSTSSLTAAGLPTKFGAVTLTSTSSLSTTAGTIRVAQAALVSTSSLVTAAAAAARSGAATLTSSSVLGTQAVVTKLGAAVLQSVSALVTAGVSFTVGRFPPDAVLEQTGLTGTLATVQDDPDSPDGNWMIGSGAVTLRVSFPLPGKLQTGANLQEFRVLVRSG